MADTDFCLMCGKTIGMWDKACKYCGANQFGDNNEFYPDEKSLEAAKKLLQRRSWAVQEDSSVIYSTNQKKIKQRKEKQPTFSQEECFLYGIHPKDKIYRKTMELDILRKNYKE